MKTPSLAGTSFDPFYHVCAFFGSRDDEYRVLAPFYHETLDWGESLVQVIDDALRTDHDQRMEQHGIDVCGCKEAGRLTVLGWSETYLRDGAFDKDLMLTAVQGVIDSARKAGVSRTRIMGNMNWALDGCPGSDDLIEYELEVNLVLAKEKQPAVCVYDVNKLSGSLMMDVMRAHPLVLMNGVVHRNPFFTTPQEMLAEVRSRKATVGAGVLA